MKPQKSKLERFAYDIVLGFVVGLFFMAIVLLLSGCPKRKDPPLRQWYPIDRCHDYARAIPKKTHPRPECLGCVGTNCDVVTVDDWTDKVIIHKLDCSGRVCLSR